MTEWDRCCHVCWNRVYALWAEAPRSDCPWGATVAHSCADALARAQTKATMLKLRASGDIRAPGWRASALPNGERHVTPLDDLRPHDEAQDCWCGPTDDDGVLVHHALDRREEYETGRAPS